MDPHREVLLRFFLKRSQVEENDKKRWYKNKHKLFNFSTIAPLFLLTRLLSTPENVKKHVITNLLLCVPVYRPILLSQTLNAPLAAFIVEDVIIYVSLFLGSCVNAEAHERNWTI